MKRFAVAAVAVGVDRELSLHIISASTWQEALNQAPSIWWQVRHDATPDAAQEQAWITYNCMIQVREID